jgi:two-component sensor histidine kinase
MQFRFKLQLFIIPLIIFIITIITMSFIFRTSGSQRKLQNEIIALNLQLIIEKSNLETSFLKQAGISDVAFYKKGAQLEVINFIKKLSIKGGHFLIMDTYGNIIYNPQFTFYSKDDFLSTINLQKYKNDKYGDITFIYSSNNRNGDRYSGKFINYKEWDWIIFCLIQNSVINQSIIQASIQVIILSIILILFASIIVFIIAKTVTNPLGLLKKKAIEISEGSMEIEVNIKGNNEFSSLSHSFNKMITNVRHNFKKIEKQRKEIEVRNNQLQVLLDDKTILLREVHHRVKNNLQIISAFMELVLENNKSQKIKEIMKTCINRIKSLALIHEKIYKSDKISTVMVYKYVEDLIQSIIKSYNKINQIQLELDIEKNFELSLDSLIPIGIIINELVTNSIKHGFKGKKNGVIHLSFKLIKENYVFSYEDNGLKFSKNPLKNIDELNTLGLEIIKNLIIQLDGNLEFVEESKKFIIEFAGYKKEV